MTERGDRRILEPACSLELYDEEHVLVRVVPSNAQALELVLEDAAWKELSRRRVTLRFNEAALFHKTAIEDEALGR